MLSDLSEEAQHHEEREEWGAYRNVRYDTAQYVKEQGEAKRAGFLYVEVLIFDLQGVSSSPGVDGFHEAYQSTSPAVVREVARFTIEAELEKAELKTVYDRVANQAWLDEFPRSKEDLWTDFVSEVWDVRKGIQLDHKVEQLGRDQLLSDAEAKSFIRRKNEYEIVRRVEYLLENERPTDIPPEKRDRAEMYLAAIDPEALADRWKAKAYRRGGEVMLSRNGQKKAREYFERALQAVDRDEVGEVERLLKEVAG